MTKPPVAESMTVALTYEYADGKHLSPPGRIDLPVTANLAAAFARAAAVNRDDVTPLSFTSLLVGMMSGGDDFSAWLETELERYGATARKIAERRSRSYDESHLRSSALSPGTELAASKSAYEAITEARAIAAAIGSGPALDVRHVAAAYPVLRNWHVADFQELGIDRLAWCRAMGAFMAKAFPDERAYWRDYADRASPVPLTSFSADVYTEHDLLGIDRSVDALALLIASTRTDTPLSIGVFGPWGSGKSFFMRHLRRRIYSLAKREQTRVSRWVEAREQGTATAAGAPLYYGQVAQVEFNAWHYNEGNLVASLVDHLFRNLRVLPDKEDQQLEERRAEVIAQVNQAEGDALQTTAALEQTQQSVRLAENEVALATAGAAAARRDVDAKAIELAQTSSEAEQARQQLDSSIQKVSAASAAVDPGAVVRVALGPLTGSPAVGEARRALDDFARTFADWQAFVAQVFTLRGAAVVALCLAAPLAAWLGDWLTDAWAAVAGAVTTGIASMSHVIGVMRERRAQFEAKLQELAREEQRRQDERRAALERERAALEARFQQTLDALRGTLEQQRAALALREAAVAEAVRDFAKRTKELDDKVRERASAEAKLRDAKAQLKRLSSAVLLEEFITERAGAEEYRKGLSLLARVRRDFEKLSDLIAAANDNWCSPHMNAPPPLLNRIVLYIDDLDRCNVETVLKVLEAVHLLLAFPLFVCVVAVDPRWIEKCLREKHSELFIVESAAPGAGAGNGETARVTVGDYLEKIFQIPIWMSPIESRQRVAVVKSLLGSTAAPEPKANMTGERRPGHDLPLEAPDADRPAPVAAGDAFQAIVDHAAETPDPLRISREEAAFVDLVGPLLSEKPRALKRFVNTYRLLKASLPDIDRQAFVSDGAASPYKICISQLALFTGQPRLSSVLVEKITRANADGLNLRAWLGTLTGKERALLEHAIAQIPESTAVPLADFRKWLPETSKYLFHRAH